MEDLSTVERAVELLQQLGLKEYEAKSLVALTRLPSGTAKRISEISDVPRTRVYDAVRVLESKGLVEIQHSNPQRFRAVPIEEAAATLRGEYESRTTRLAETLSEVEPMEEEDELDVTHEVWALSGAAAISGRARQFVAEADSEVVFVVGREGALTDELAEALQDADARGVTVIVGTTTEAVREVVERTLPGAETFVSGLEWLSSAAMADDDTEISRLLLADRSSILVSTVHANGRVDGASERAVFGRGFDNGLVAIARRLMATGLLPVDDPSTRLTAGEQDAEDVDSP